MTLRTMILDTAQAVLNGSLPDRNTITAISGARGSDAWTLLSSAHEIRSRFRGDPVNICSIVNAKSGACSEDCAYCAQSAHHRTNAQVYPLITLDEIRTAAESARSNKAGRFCIVTSGRGIESDQDLDRIANSIALVHGLGMRPCATLGILDRDQLALLKHAGLDRYHHNIETSRDYFPRVCSTHSFDERLAVLRSAQSLGLSTCSGGIFGMGETLQDRIDMAFTLRELDVDSVPINFLMPIPGTPFGDMPPLRPLDALISIALYRFILPNKEIRVCAGRVSGLRHLHTLAFSSGADGFMIGNYLTKSGPDPGQDLAMLKDLGMAE